MKENGQRTDFFTSMHPEKKDTFRIGILIMNALFFAEISIPSCQGCMTGSVKIPE